MRFRVLVVLSLLAAACGSSPAPNLTTIAEQSGFTRTGRYDEVQQLCAAFERAYPSKVRCFEFGRTPENRPMLALAASADGVLSATAARTRNRPVVLMQGGIHAGEIDGKDAGFLALRQLLDVSSGGSAGDGALGRVTFVFVPVFNVDGHERFGKWNRPNQVGPEQMGWRVTAQNLNLNRDYVKADAPEMRNMLRLMNEWDPILYADLHVTDGAQFQHDVSLTVAPTLAGDPEQIEQGRALTSQLLQRLTKQGSMPVDFYPDFVMPEDPATGFAVAVSQPRFSHQYAAERNRFGVLVETHSWKDYATRVRVTRNAIIDMLELAAANGEQWLTVAHASDQRALRAGGTTVPLTFRNTAHVKTIPFQGYAYTRDVSPISGALVTHYDPKTPQTMQLPLRDEVEPDVTSTAPRGGYIVPAADAAWVAEKLAVHGIASRVLTEETRNTDLQTFRATKTSTSMQTFEGHATRAVEGAWAAERRTMPAGSLFVPIAQPKSHLVMMLFEPGSPDSLLAWGFFNNAFEQKEYMEPYVAHMVGTDMLAANPALKAEFEQRLRDDPEFAKSPQARLDFFYRRSPSYDERLNLYPVARVEREP